MPRVGLAYRPANKWVIRSGAGWFADVEHLNTFTILANMPPFGSSQQFDAVIDPGKTVTVTANQTEYRIATRQFRPAAPSLPQLVEEVLHERILRFRIPGTSSLPTKLDVAFWRPKPGALGESARSRDTAFAIRDMMMTRTFERAGIASTCILGSPGIQRK